MLFTQEIYNKHRIVLEKVHSFIKFNQKACLKSRIDMKTKLRKNAKNYFEKYFFKLINNSVVGKTIENVRKHRYIKLATTEKREKIVGIRTKLSYNIF